VRQRLGFAGVRSSIRNDDVLGMSAEQSQEQAATEFQRAGDVCGAA
jgi:hypothetical protein